MSATTSSRPVVLCILDGWGNRSPERDNAIAVANTPTWDALIKNNPVTDIGTSGLDVGLPAGQMGNSEVGHMNIGAGRIVMQDLPRIDKSIADGELAKHPLLQNLIEDFRETDKSCHIMGLLSDGGVHSHQNHIWELIRILSSEHINVCLHLFLDGRDTPPSSAALYIEALQDVLALCPTVRIATVSGRYYAMDRDKRWDRVELAYHAMVDASGVEVASPEQAVKDSYANDKTDEFVVPAVCEGYQGMQDGDALLMANFRSDRVREILTALVDESFDGFDRSHIFNFSHKIGMVEYSSALSKDMQTLFPSESLEDTLGSLISDAGLKQLRIAETEKYAHVTFFFNGGKEEVFEGEERILIPSPDVPTYDLKPEMSAMEVTDQLCGVLEKGETDLIVVNYANGDMVGHTGSMEAAIKAAETIDAVLARLSESVQKAGGVLCITADHGNVEMMVDPKTSAPHTAHTTNPVPFVLAGCYPEGAKLQSGRLCDIAPTILDLMELEQPVAMTGGSLIMQEQRVMCL